MNAWLEIDIVPEAYRTALRQRRHRVRHPVGDQGMAQPSRRRHHRRRHLRPHRAQHGMDRHRRGRHEVTARAVHARILALGVSGLENYKYSLQAPPLRISSFIRFSIKNLLY